MYTLHIYNSSGDVDDTARAGYLAPYNNFIFGLYSPEAYTSLSGSGMFILRLYVSCFVQTNINCQYRKRMCILLQWRFFHAREKCFTKYRYIGYYQ